MCGISGQMKLDSTAADRKLVRRMTSTLAHRGPDGEGYFFDRMIGLGHRRLSIIDLESGAQPMLDQPATLALAANNEIYNYVELRQELAAKGHRFATRSDTEVILRLFEEERERSFGRLEGMFALALWDGAGDTLYLARDRFGIKPLYYHRDASCLIFASEMKAILQYRSLDRTLDAGALDAFFGSLALPEPLTVFRNVHKVPPGHYLRVRGNRVNLVRYWDASREIRGRSSVHNGPARLLEEMQRSVRISLRSDVPVGVLLSGGLDSSSIAALAARESGDRVHSFSAAFQEGDFNEGGHARLVARYFGTRHHEVVVTKRKATAIASLLAERLDEPFADSSSIPMYAVCELAATHVKTVLSGEGADELFGGYPWHGARSYEEHPARVVFTRQERADFYSVPRSARSSRRGHDRASGVSLLKRSLIDDLDTYLPSDILFKSDRVSMMHSLEVRVPFLNHQLAGFALRLPDRMKVDGTTRKVLLRRAMADLLPDSVIERAKKGFSIPMDLWLWEKGAWRELIYDTIFSRSLQEREQFDMKTLELMQREHDHLERLHGYRLWTVFIFEMWQRNFGG